MSTVTTIDLICLSGRPLQYPISTQLSINGNHRMALLHLNIYSTSKKEEQTTEADGGRHITQVN